MANLAIIRQRVRENSNEMSGGAPCKVANLMKMANLTKVANLANSCASWTSKITSESRSFLSFSGLTQ